MASLYKRPNSPYYWISWIDPEHPNKASRFSTECLIGDPKQFRSAVVMRDECALKESKGKAASREHPFSEWVRNFLAVRYHNSDKTEARYQSVWNTFKT